MLRFYFFSPLSFHTFVSLKKKKDANLNYYYYFCHYCKCDYHICTGNGINIIEKLYYKPSKYWKVFF